MKAPNAAPNLIWTTIKNLIATYEGKSQNLKNVCLHFFTKIINKLSAHILMKSISLRAYNLLALCDYSNCPDLDK